MSKQKRPFHRKVFFVLIPKTTLLFLDKAVHNRRIGVLSCGYSLIETSYVSI